MGRTLPSITQVFLSELGSGSPIGRFRRALRRSDQVVLDGIFAAAHQHLASAAYAASALPFEIFLLAIVLEQQKELLRLRQQLGLDLLPGLQLGQEEEAGAATPAGFLDE